MASTEIVGEIVHVYCYLARGGRGRAHKRCAQDCIDNGGEMGLVTRGGKLYRIKPGAGGERVYELLKGRVAEEVCLIGDVSRTGGALVILPRTLKPAPPSDSGRS